MLSENQIHEYEAALLALQQEVNEQLVAIDAWCEPVAPDVSLGRLTRTDAMQDQQMALYQRQHLLQRQVRLQTALKRIAAGVFGVCPVCKRPIDTRRLDVAPDSPLCVACLEK